MRRIDAAEMKRALAHNEVNKDCHLYGDGNQHLKGDDSNQYNHTRNNPNAMIDQHHADNNPKDMEMR